MFPLPDNCGGLEMKKKAHFADKGINFATTNFEGMLDKQKQIRQFCCKTNEIVYDIGKGILCD